MTDCAAVSPLKGLCVGKWISYKHIIFVQTISIAEVYCDNARNQWFEPVQRSHNDGIHNDSIPALLGAFDRFR